MAYKNPIPVILDKPVTKKVTLTFNFDNYVTREDAAESLTKLFQDIIKDHGSIPKEWIKLIDPTDCVELDDKIKDNLE